MRESDRDYGRGYAAVTDSDGVADSVRRRAVEITPRGEHHALFGPGEIERDGWWWDAGREVWIVPDRERPFEPVRSRDDGAVVASDGAARAASGAGGKSARGSSRAAVAKQQAAAARLSDDELRQHLANAERWERWCTDPRAWVWRWDRRVLYVGRALRREFLREVDAAAGLRPPGGGGA